MTLAQQQLQAEYDKVKMEEVEKSQKLQELMSVNYKKRSFPCSNKSKHLKPNSHLLKPKQHWEEFIPYKNEFLSVSNKFEKEAINNLTKLTKNQCNMSIFHIHTFHLHLFISLTLLLVTHRCPQYLVVV